MKKRDEEILISHLEYLAERNKDIATSLRNILSRIDDQGAALKAMLDKLSKDKP
jgi:hypothetical protein